MKTRREFLKSMAAVIWMCGVLTGCSGSVGAGPAQGGTGKEDSADSGSAGTGTKPDTNVPNLETYRKEVLRLVNQERANAGVGALTMDDVNLSNAAQVRAKEIIELFSHTRPDGTSCFTALTEQGVQNGYAGENIAAGYATPEKVVDGWMHSEGHRENILNAHYRKLGVGYYYQQGSQYGAYWVQMFTD